MHRYYVTYADRNYLVRMITLARSLSNVERQPYTLICGCFDSITRLIITKLDLPNVECLPLEEIENFDFPLITAKTSRSIVEYYWTLTPAIILHAMNKYSDCEMMTYTDADTMFFSSPEPIFHEMGPASIMIHEHRYQKETMHLKNQSGIFNVGLISFRNNHVGREALSWWKDRCVEWCYARFEDGKFGDQKYLDDWPRRFEDVHVLEHLGAGTAPWNQGNYIFSRDNSSKVLVDAQELIHYHFHGLEIHRPGIYLTFKYNYFIQDQVLEHCYVPYVEELEQTQKMVSEILPSFVFGLGANPELMRVQKVIINNRLDPQKLGLSLAPNKGQISKGWDYYYPSI